MKNILAWNAGTINEEKYRLARGMFYGTLMVLPFWALVGVIIFLAV
ncbi:hypothetical protein [Gorillibacterium massiliense]|nr:hypothetical protein [Gorillibacterium massiliense]